MHINKQRQYGGSPIVTLIVIAILAYGVFVGVQYIPQWMEARSVDSILDSVQESYANRPAGSDQDIVAQVIRMLQVNEMNDMTENFSVSRSGSGYSVTFKWERQLNLGFETRSIQFERSIYL